MRAFEYLPPDPRLIDYILKENPKHFTGFNGKMEVGGRFGFNDGLKVIDGDSGGIAIELPILPLEQLTDEPCLECNGTRKQDFFGDEMRCIFCHQTGRRLSIDHRPLFVNAKTLSLILSVLPMALPDSFKNTDEPPFQLFHVDTMAELRENGHGASLGGSFSEPLVRWLREFTPEAELADVTVSMRHVWKLTHLTKSEFGSLDTHNIWACVRAGGKFLANCPGSACGLHPEDMNNRPEPEGYKFSCHNVDTCAQQLTLLTALAALSDMAVEAGVGHVV